jgi:hypothetical protein
MGASATTAATKRSTPASSPAATARIRSCARDAVYLLRPDTCVALAHASGDADVLERTFAERQIMLPAAPDAPHALH